MDGVAKEDPHIPESPSAFVIRGRDVVLARDVALQLGVPTGRLNQNLARNPEKFTEAYAFRLTGEEFQILIAEEAAKGRLQALGDLRQTPWVLTERGIFLSATVLRTPQAVELTHRMVEVFWAAKSLEHVLVAAAPQAR